MLTLGIFKDTAMGIFLFIDGVIYDFIRHIYDVFLQLANLNLFSSDSYYGIVRRIYIILGIVMLFALAYSLLKAVINPDDFAKGENSFPNLIKNVVISIIIIAILPYVFDIAYRIQNSVLQTNVIGKIILPSTEESDINNGGPIIASSIYKAFLYPTAEDDPYGDSISASESKFCLLGCDTMTFHQAMNSVENDQESFKIFANFSSNADDGELEYNMIISTVAGIFVLWVLLLFCFDLGVRVIKLLFYQIIAPIPVICRILPSGDSKKIWDNWVKYTFNTYIEVFIRLFIMYIGVYLIILVRNFFEDAAISDKYHDVFTALSGSGYAHVKYIFLEVMVIMGIIAFIRMAPKLISDLFGIDTGNIKLGLSGLKERLSSGGTVAAAGAGALAGGITAATRNAVGAKGFRKFTSGVGGFLGGAGRGLSQGAKAKSFADFKKGTASAIKATTDAADAKSDKRDERNRAIEEYMAKNGGSKYRAAAAVAGQNIQESMQKFAGIDQFDKYKKEMDFYGMIKSNDDKIDQYAVDLLGKDKIKDSASIMEKATGIAGNSLSSAQQFYEMMHQKNVSDLLKNGPADVKNLDGTSRTINDEKDYANYLTKLRSDINQAERDVKKYLKQQGFRGLTGVNEISSLLEAEGQSLGDGELRILSNIQAQRDDTINIIKEHSGDLEKLNNNVHDVANRVSDIGTDENAWEHMDQLVKNAKQREADIYAELSEMQRKSKSSGKSNDK